MSASDETDMCDGAGGLRACAVRGRRPRPRCAGEGLQELGGGLDHGAFVAGDLVVRVAESAARAEVAREAELLRSPAHVPIPVPVLGDALRAYGHGTAGFRRRIAFFARCAALEDRERSPGDRRAAERSLSWSFPGSEEPTA